MTFNGISEMSMHAKLGSCSAGITRKQVASFAYQISCKKSITVYAGLYQEM